MKLLFAPVPHDEAADMLRRLPAVTRAVYDQLAPELRALAFVITGIDDATQLQAAKDIIASLPAGADFREAKERLVAQLPFTGEKAQRRAELILRHWGNIAYGAAAWQHLNRQRDTFPWWQYGGSTSRKRRETHKALEGIILRHDDPFWDTHFPPWEPGCNCQHPIALMDADVEKIREEDKNLPPDERRVLEGAILKKLHEEQTLVRGINDIYDMRTPAERGESWQGWHPDNLAKGLDIAKVQADLSPGVFGKLQIFLTAQKLPGGGNVWDWWKARQPKAGPAPAAPVPARANRKDDHAKLPGPPPAGAAAPVPPPSPGGRKAAPLPTTQPARTEPELQVARHLLIKGPPSLVAETVPAAGEAIASVHSNGGLKETPVAPAPPTANFEALYRRSTSDARLAADPLDFDTLIQLRPGTLVPQTSLVHEVGHKILEEVIAARPEVARAYRAILRALDETARAAQIREADADTQDMLRPAPEMFCRGYAQWIMTRSTAPGLVAEYEQERRQPLPRRLATWEPEDFSPLIPLYDTLFRALGWLL